MSDVPQGPLYGTSVRAHAEHLMADIEERVRASFAVIRESKRIRPAERTRLGRQLAGAIGSLESIRLWLDAGAPQ